MKIRKKTTSAAAAALLAAGCFAACLAPEDEPAGQVGQAAVDGPLPFASEVDISSGSVVGLSAVDAADINGDGLNDVLTLDGGAAAQNGIVTFAWFESKANGSWVRHNLTKPSPLQHFIGAAKLGDMDNDGDPDLVVAHDMHSGPTKSAYIHWLENPGGAQSLSPNWQPHTIVANLAVHHINDMELADMDGDAKLDVVVRHQSSDQIRVYFQNTADSFQQKVINASFGKEGIGVGDIDADGLTDITASGYWFDSPSNPRTQNYIQRTIDGNYHNINPNTKEAVGDIDGDGKLDVLLSPAEGLHNGNNHVLAWYKQPSNVTQSSAWQRIDIKGNYNAAHTAKLADMDGDGDLDVLSGVAWNLWGQQRAIRVFYNLGAGNFGNEQQVVLFKGLYTGVAVDIGGDGDMDIVGQDRYSTTSKPWFYESLAADNNPTPTCSDGVKNQGESGVDCGGPCPACVTTCNDGIQNQGETGVDCGGPCPSCGSTPLVQLLFEEGVGTVANDSIGNNDGSWSGSASPLWSSDTPDGSNYALAFDGSNDRVSLPSFNVNGSAMSLVAWVKPDVVSNEGRIISKATGINGSEHVFMLSFISNNKPRFRLKTNGSTTTLAGTVGVTPGVWSHLAATYNGSQMKLYLNGQLVGTANKSGNINQSNAGVAVGNQPNGAGDRPYDGVLDRVRVYGYALSAADIVDQVQNEPNSGPSCSDGMQNQGETGVDCGGPCPACAPTCNDGVKNQGEAGVDCGGPCPACAPTCNDGVQNQGEAGVDCGGPCPACAATCNDGVQNQGETGVDCGGPCPSCGSGPLLQLLFDEGGGSTTVDSIGNNNGSWSGSASPAWTSETPDNSAHALSFDGSNDRVTLPSFNVAGNAMSLVAWVKPDVVNNEGRIVSKATGINGSQHIFMLSFISNNKPRFRLSTNGNTTTLIGSSGVTPGVWSHLAATYDGSQMRLYVNGQLSGATGKSGNITQSNAGVAVGNQPNGAGARPFDGIIDRLRVYGHALSPSDIGSQVQDEPMSGPSCSDGLQNQGEAGVDCGGPCPACPTNDNAYAFWAFDEGSGNAAYDAAGMLDGSFSGSASPSWTSDTPDGSAYALDFDGSNDRIALPSFNIPGNALTISGWMKADVVSNEGRIISKATGVYDYQHDFMVSFISGNKLRFRLRTNNVTTTLVSAQAVPTNTWLHFAAVYDGSTMRLYLNGSQVAVVNKSGNIAQSNAGVCIGNQPPGAGARPFDGTLDRLKIYDYAFSAAEVLAQANE